MADILRRAATLAIQRASCGNLRTVFPLHARTVFTSSGIGIDNFKLSREQHASRYAPSIDAFKKRFVDSIGQTDSQIFTEDLRNAIMSANDDKEIDTVIKALKKYSTSKEKFTDYHFGSPVMRLLYVHNKTDLAMQLFMDESLKDIFNDSASALVLMNKLIEEQRYDEAGKVFDYGCKRGFSTTSGRAFPSDVTMLAVEALYRQNTKESLSKAKELVSKVKEGDSDLNPRAAAWTALLAIQQGEPSFAMEVVGAVRGQNLTTVQNIRAICYAEMGRIEEAINVVQLLADQVSNNSDRRRVFPLTMRHIRMAVEKTKDQTLLTRFDELSKSVLKNNRLSTTDLPEFLSQPINRRPMRQGVQQISSGSAQRTGGNFRNFGYGQRFNQQSNNMRQEMTGGYNRPMGGYNNRFGMGNNQSGRFGNNNFQRLDSGYDRRSQNSYVDGYRRSNDNDRFQGRNRQTSPNQDYRFQQTTSPTKRSGQRSNFTDESNSESKWVRSDNVDSNRSNRRDVNNQQPRRNRSTSPSEDNENASTSTWQNQDEKSESTSSNKDSINRDRSDRQ